MSNENLKDSALYKTLYSEMTEGVISEMYAMHGGTIARHKKLRNNLAENIALAIVNHYDKQGTLSTARIDHIVNALKYKLSGFKSRTHTAAEFGFKEGKEVVIMEDQAQYTQCVQHIVELSNPLAQRFYKELTEGRCTYLKGAMHAGSISTKRIVVGAVFLPLVALYSKSDDLVTRNSLATNISISIQVKVRQNQDKETEAQVNEGIHGMNMLLDSFGTRDSFAEYYQRYREHFVSSVSTSLVRNDQLKKKVIYKLLYEELTEGNLSEAKAMYAGVMGVNKQYQYHLAENIALAIARCSEKDMTDIRVNDIVQALENKLSAFSSRTQTATAFGWQEKWSGKNVINNHTEHTEFISDIVGLCSMNCSSDDIIVHTDSCV